MKRRLLCRTILLVATVCGPLAAADIDFDRDVKPILLDRCVDCHGPDQAESALRLDTAIAALRGGDSGEQVIVPGDSSKSYLVERIAAADAKDRMPPDDDPLSPEEIQILSAWIDQRESWKAAQEALATEKSDHWSFQPVRRPPVPTTAATDEHPVDAFIRSRLAEDELTLSPMAERRQRIRRLYLVMHGLPPTPEAVERFVNDNRPDAWQRVVDDVLESPHYGERFATFWLDLVRFGESHGFETNRERPNAWRYRDWVIDSLNRDKSYDEFVRQQIAGDVLGEGLGTGFLVAGPYDLVKGQDKLLRLTQRQDELADMINTTGTAFLGLTLGCARCHNHKFDPVSQKDYYAMQAVFAGVNHADRKLPLPDDATQRIAELQAEMEGLEDALSPYLHRPALRPAVTATENTEKFAPTAAKFVRFTIEQTNASQPCIDELEVFAEDKNVALASRGTVASSSGDFVHPLHKLVHINDGEYGNSRSWISAQTTGGWVQLEFPEVEMIDRILWARDRLGKYADRVATKYRIESSLDGEQWQLLASSADRTPFSAKTPPVIYDFSKVPAAEAEEAKKQLARLEQLREQVAGLKEPVMAYVGTFSQPGPTFRLYRGEPTAPREQVGPAVLDEFQQFSDVRLDVDAPERERRLAVANWIANEANPLTARVMVNRIWQFHFGTGIVDTPSDFGANGTPPTHPELLDWLAAEFVEHGWSIKSMHRLLLTSRTWQQSSRPRSDAVAVDAGTRLLWRFPPRRLEAEGIRDCMVAVSGKLNPKAGGPGFSAFEVELENVRHYFPKSEYSDEDWRRMVYMTRVRQERDAVFGVFDCPDFNQVVPQRSRSTTPLQALNLLNSRFVNQQAEFLAARISAVEEPVGRVQLAYQLCYSRAASDEEVAAAVAFVEVADWKQFARALLNSNEFVFIP